jgi:SOS-response transcriptional repressor LexA
MFANRTGRSLYSSTSKDQGQAIGVSDPLKRARKEGNRVFLVPENDRCQTLEITEGSDFEIWGRVTGRVRAY